MLLKCIGSLACMSCLWRYPRDSRAMPARYGLECPVEYIQFLNSNAKKISNGCGHVAETFKTSHMPRKYASQSACAKHYGDCAKKTTMLGSLVSGVPFYKKRRHRKHKDETNWKKTTCATSNSSTSKRSQTNNKTRNKTKHFDSVAGLVSNLVPRLGRFWIQITLEDRKYGYFWIFPHHSCENIQKYFEFLDTFGYSPIISEPLICHFAPPMLDRG